IGNLSDCIAAAAAAAQLTDYKVKELPAMIDPFEKLVEQLSGAKEAAIAKELLGENYKVYQQAKEAASWQGVQARLPFILNTGY
ncbi:MAG: signal peptide peptidase SppA, partial [Flavobacteriales bacterium]